MPVDLFGFRIGRKPEEETPPSVQSFAPPPNEDGAIAVNEGGAFGVTVDMDGTLKNEPVLISRYRDMAQQPECERAVDDIVNECIVYDDGDMPVSIVLDQCEKVPERVKDRIREEFDTVLSLLHFENKAYDIFRNWYVDGRIYYHLMIDTNKPREGIQELRFIDPRKIKKVRSEKKNNKAINPAQIEATPKKYSEYYIYSQSYAQSNQTTQSVAYA
jgi:hypothetical protein